MEGRRVAGMQSDEVRTETGVGDRGQERDRKERGLVLEVQQGFERDRGC